MNGIYFILWLLVCGLVYIPVGVLVFLKGNKKVIRNRSPLLVSIAHWSNFMETVCLLLSLYIYFSGSVPDKFFDGFYQIVVIIVHYSYFIAYMLRCYRVYFIFNLDNNRDETDSFFKANIHRAGQKWLFKVFMVLLWPAVVIAAARIVIPGLDNYFPSSYYEGQSDVTIVSEAIYLFLLFLEELAFITSVFKLRHVKDDFNMTVEVTIVCVLWVLTGMFSIFPENWIWRLEVIIRNHIIMAISSIYPLVKSFNAESFEEVITIEMLQSLEVILQSEITLNAYEKAISECTIKNYKGSEILKLWLKCENFKYKETLELENEIFETAKRLKMFSKSINGIESECFHIMNQHFFPYFRETAEYKEILHEIVQNQIYITRIMQTSLVGGVSSPHTLLDSK